MSPLLIVTLTLSIVGTSFLSGIFGMAGGMILIGILLAVMPLPAAMALHAVTQMASNGSRAGLWIRHVRWRAVIAFNSGALVTLIAWSLIRYVPDKAVALLLLGVSPFAARLVPQSLRPDPEQPLQASVYGALCTCLLLLTGVTGPLIDTFFLGGRYSRHEIVASKSACQIIAHALKLVYFGGVIDAAAGIDPLVALLAVIAAIVGTVLARRILEAMSDTQYRAWANRIITTIGAYYIGQGGYLLVTA